MKAALLLRKLPLMVVRLRRCFVTLSTDYPMNPADPDPDHIIREWNSHYMDDTKMAATVIILGPKAWVSDSKRDHTIPSDLLTSFSETGNSELSVL